MEISTILSKLRVTLEKLERYAKNQGGYEIFVDGDSIALSFVPVFPEALEKGDSSTPRVTMTGKLTGGKVDFQKVEIENSSGSRERNLEESELVYKSWLDFIEDNY
jgi:hypothetical protein